MPLGVILGFFEWGGGRGVPGSVPAGTNGMSRCQDVPANAKLAGTNGTKKIVFIKPIFQNFRG